MVIDCGYEYEVVSPYTIVPPKIIKDEERIMNGTHLC